MTSQGRLLISIEYLSCGFTLYKKKKNLFTNPGITLLICSSPTTQLCLHCC
uniref:Uncharacterized protein n=1 Tax=Anguilla anguilla TaxID=7936 RepID=A0A0E9S0L5_ANGAN